MGQTFVITGRTPSKKNSKRWQKYGAKMFLVPSEQFNVWYDEAVLQMAEQLRGLNLPIKTDKISITIFYPDRRASDLTNKAESVMDLLVDCGVITDDNWFEVKEVHLYFGGVDKDKPRAEIQM